MKYNLPFKSFTEKIQELDTAVFYCMNEASEKVPVSVVRSVHFVSDNILEFTSASFPTMENNWNIFGAELHFHKKGIPYDINLYGIAYLVRLQPLTIQFKITGSDYFQHEDFKPNIFAELFLTTGTFFKNLLTTGF